MKFFYRKFLTALLFLFFAFNAKAVNDTLTFGQAFDWSVGDTFVYQAVEFTPTQHIDSIGFSVLTRSNIGDTIIYTLLYANDTIEYNLTIPHANESLTSNWFFTPIDLSIYDCSFTSYYGELISFHDTELNNLVTDSFTYLDQSYPGLYHTSAFTEKIGVKTFAYKFHNFDPHGQFTTTCSLHLIYYKSASTGFIYNDVAEISNVKEFFTISPNPATDEITVTTENEAPVDVSVYDMLGNCVLTHKNISHNPIKLFFNRISPGYYLLKLTDQNGLSSSKGFIIAR